MSHKLTSAQSELIRKKQIANAVAKVQAGKSLNKAEQSLLDSITEKPQIAAEEKSRHHPIVDGVWFVPSMTAAAGTTGYSITTVQAAKNAGCKAFKRNGNVDCAALMRWVKGNPESVAEAESKEEADARVSRVRANRMEFELGVRRKMFIPVDEVRQTFTRSYVAFRSKMLSLPASLAPRLALNSSAEECAAMVKASIVEALTELCKCKWNQPSPKKK